MAVWWQRLEESTAGRVLLYLVLLPWIMAAVPIAFFMQYVLDRDFDLEDFR